MHRVVPLQHEYVLAVSLALIVAMHVPSTIGRKVDIGKSVVIRKSKKSVITGGVVE